MTRTRTPSVDELVGVLAHGAVDQPEEPGDLVVGTSPVLGAERVDAQRLDAAVARAADDRADRLDALDVAGEDRQAALARPATIAVGDDRHVAGSDRVRHRSDLQDLGFLAVGARVDRLDVPIGQLLEGLELTALLVLGRGRRRGGPS